MAHEIRRIPHGWVGKETSSCNERVQMEPGGAARSRAH
jgi:hypothetical protein